MLFLADRNILVDQAIQNDFRPFGGVMKKLNRSLVDDGGRMDTSYEIYFSLYQAITGDEGKEPIYDKFPKDFFDLIVVDECHQGSAAEDSAWREVLEYFNSAIHLGMTATPKETKYVSNIHYFGEPVYTYSLKQGIEDGFLTPYKVVRVDFDRDLLGWRPEAGQVDDTGAPIEDRIYNQRDIDQDIVFPERDQAVADRITSFLHDTDPMHKTIVFCQSINHAERMRQALVNTPENVSPEKARFPITHETAARHPFENGVPWQPGVQSTRWTKHRHQFGASLSRKRAHPRRAWSRNCRFGFESDAARFVDHEMGGASVGCRWAAHRAVARIP